jgi:glycosyltransferase involved in cell wall biosynthesis
MGRIAGTRADVVHGHGAKGGAYARLAFNASRAVRTYTPHGGSLLFGHDTTAGKFYLATEKLLMRRGDLFLFESAYSAEVFRRKIGKPNGLVCVVHNGVSEKDFAPIKTQADATDLVFMGELRPVKGIDVLIDAIATLNRHGRPVTATLVGDGPDRDSLRAQVDRLDLAKIIRFQPAMSAREAQKMGRVMVSPSRAESLPYVVLEAAAAGVPLITTKVGGIPEIYGPLSDRLVAPQDVGALADAIVDSLDRPEGTAETARQLRERVSQLFSVKSMVDGVLAAYQSALDRLRQSGRR